MEQRMARFHMILPLVGLVLAGAAFAGPDDKVKSVKVEMDITALTNAAAAVRFAKTADDLQGAILARLVDRTAETGMDISIDLSEVELSNSYTDAVGAADTRLVGVVNVSDMQNNTNFNTYELTVNVEQAASFFPPDFDRTTLTASSDVFYKAMIDAFADGVVTRLDE
jgi:hypothetical protein